MNQERIMPWSLQRAASLARAEHNN